MMECILNGTYLFKKFMNHKEKNNIIIFKWKES